MSGRRLTFEGRSPRHLYVHVPFCRERCDYCEFASEAVGEPEGATDRLDAFVDAVRAEWTLERERWGVRRLETVYLGGGTPSLLGSERLERLLEPLEPLLTPKAEVTVETNPEDVTPAYAAWAAARRLRLSLGVQSFSARVRETLGRRAAADPAAAFATLRAAGVANLGIDLIFGVPGQRLADVGRELDVIERLHPDHVSWYELTIEEGTSLAARVARRDTAGLSGRGPAGVAGAGRLEPVDSETQEDMYGVIVAGLEERGFTWYEVSNFASPGKRCRHNGAYWRGSDYLGLGPAAVSTVGETRWRNDADTKAYVAALSSDQGGPEGRDGRPAPPHREPEHLDEVTRTRERLLLAARTGAGVPLAELAPALDHAALEPLERGGYISTRGGTLRVTRKGRHVANGVCVRLFRDSRL